MYHWHGTCSVVAGRVQISVTTTSLSVFEHNASQLTLASCHAVLVLFVRLSSIPATMQLTAVRACCRRRYLFPPHIPAKLGSKLQHSFPGEFESCFWCVEPSLQSRRLSSSSRPSRIPFFSVISQVAAASLLSKCSTLVAAAPWRRPSTPPRFVNLASLYFFSVHPLASSC